MEKRIRQVRKQGGLSQEEFASDIGVTRAMLASYELARVVPRDAILKLICAKYGVSYDWLKNGEGDMFPSINPSLTSTVLKILEGENETAKAVFTALAAFGDEEWAMVQKFIDSLK